MDLGFPNKTLLTYTNEGCMTMTHSGHFIYIKCCYSREKRTALIAFCEFFLNNKIPSLTKAGFPLKNYDYLIFKLKCNQFHMIK